VAEGADDGYRFSWDVPFQRDSSVLGGFWFNVSGGGLPGNVSIRFHRHNDGRYVFTGLVISEALPEPPEITSRNLRHVRLADIQAAVFGPDGLAFDPAIPGGGSNPAAPGVARWLADLAATHGQTAAGEARGPGEQPLRAFADTYKAELAHDPRRAMTAAARAHRISRATAHRWADACRRLGYLPGKDQSS
jgi:hypothetical protein